MSMAIKMSMSRPGQSSQFHVYVDFNISFWKSKSGKVSEEGLHQNGWLVKILWCHVTKEERHQIFLLASLSSSLLASRSLSTFSAVTLSKSKSKLQSAVERYQNPSQENVGGRLQYERWLCRPSRKVVPLDRKNITNITNGRGTWSQEHYKWHHITSGGLHLKSASQVPSEPFWWKYSNSRHLWLKYSTRSALLMAIDNENLEMVELLLESKVL